MKVPLVWLSILAFLLGANCRVGQKVRQHCLEEIFDFILATDNEAKLHQNEELLLIINFNGQTRESFRLALFPKSVYPKYLMTEPSVIPEGYLNYQGLRVFVYGTPPKKLHLQPVNHTWTFLKPSVRKQPPEGHPPYPPVPVIVEPVIYTYASDQHCFKLIRQNIADALFE